MNVDQDMVMSWAPNLFFWLKLSAKKKVGPQDFLTLLSTRGTWAPPVGRALHMEEWRLCDTDVYNLKTSLKQALMEYALSLPVARDKWGDLVHCHSQVIPGTQNKLSN